MDQHYQINLFVHFIKSKRINNHHFPASQIYLTGFTTVSFAIFNGSTEASLRGYKYPRLHGSNCNLYQGIDHSKLTLGHNNCMKGNFHPMRVIFYHASLNLHKRKSKGSAQNSPEFAT